MQRRTWKKPALIVLARSKPEEKVLVYCKYVAPTGPNSTQTGCRTGTITSCLECTAPGPS